MSVTYLATGVGASGTTTPLTFTDTIPAGTDCTLIGVSNFGTTEYPFPRAKPAFDSFVWTMYDGFLSPPPVSASIGGTAATLVAAIDVSLDSWQPNYLYLYCFSVFNPPAGSQTARFNGGANHTSVMTAVHYQNV